MSPVAIFLRELRLRAGLTQLDLARRLRYEQGYISALELGLKSPSNEFLERLTGEMSLIDEDQERLFLVARQSLRHFALPSDASTATFLFCFDLWERIGRLHPAVLQAMHSMIRVDEAIVNRPQVQPSRIRRRTKTEAPM